MYLEGEEGDAVRKHRASYRQIWSVVGRGTEQVELEAVQMTQPGWGLLAREDESSSVPQSDVEGGRVFQKGG